MNFLGNEVTRTPTSLYLSQSKYILDLLKKTMLDAKPSGRRLSLHVGKPLSYGTNFRSLIWAMQYFFFTRPDITFALNQVCQFMHSPTSAHWAAVKRILGYLKATHDHGVVYKPSPLTINACVNAN